MDIMSTYLRILGQIQIHKVQDGHLRANILNIKAVEKIDERVRAELAEGDK